MRRSGVDMRSMTRIIYSPMLVEPFCLMMSSLVAMRTVPWFYTSEVRKRMWRKLGSSQRSLNDNKTTKAKHHSLHLYARR